MTISYTRQLGGVMGVAIAAVLVAWRETVHSQQPDGLVTADAQAFMMLALLFLFATVAACFTKQRSAGPGTLSSP